MVLSAVAADGSASSAALPLARSPGRKRRRTDRCSTPEGATLRTYSASKSRTTRRGKGSFLLAHSLMAADVALAFARSARSHPGHQLLDWESYEQGRTELWESRLIPDARLAYTTPAWRLDAFVEIDLATEGTRFYSAKVRRYLDYYRSDAWRAKLHTWPAVLTVTPTAQRAGALRVATESVLASDAERIAQATRFAFASLDDLLAAHGPLGAIWQVAGRDGLHGLIPEERQEMPNLHG